MQDVVALLDRDESTGLVRLRGLLAEWPHDPRLHFLNGSLKASNGDFAGAALAMRRSLDIAPDYDLARFQLGFLHLTSGEPVAAQESWGPLFGLPQSSYLRTFVDGLCHMIRDEFPEAIAALEKGVALNTEIPAMNRDMELLLAELRGRRAGSDGDGERDEAPLSATQMLLRQASLKATKH
jgi:tetratricopeptide (TPR) repeat protein